MLKQWLAIILGKSIFALTRTLKLGGGSAAPGLYALKVDPKLVTKLARKLPKTVVITGTNGKTTTARLLAHFAKAENLKVIRNKTGSNLKRGVASALIEHTNLMGQLPKFDLAIWELDEAAFNKVAPIVNPDLVIFLNVFRDQLDRYGEIDTVVNHWCSSLQSLPQTNLILVNADDQNTYKLKRCFKGTTQSFGLKDYQIVGEAIKLKKQLSKPDFEANNIVTQGLSGVVFNLSYNHQTYHLNLPIPGIYHIYDLLAAFGAGSKLGFEAEKMINSLKDFSPAFGRFEKFSLQARDGYIFLIKNPAGATQVFATIAPNLNSNDRLLLALNDNLADGTDVSWIWDADFEQLINSPAKEWFVSGSRALDLANRLKYAGVDTKLIQIEPDLNKALKKAKANLTGRLFITPTYTALLELQKIMAKSGIKLDYWRES